MKKSLRFLLLAAGLGLFGWFIQRTGWNDIRGTYEALGWLGFLVLIPYTIVFSIDTLGWRFTFGPTALANVPYLVTWRIRLCGSPLQNRPVHRTIHLYCNGGRHGGFHSVLRRCCR